MGSVNKGFCPTANEFIAIEQIGVKSGAARSAAFLYELARGTQVLSGGERDLIVPTLAIDGEPVPLAGLKWEKIGFWVPKFSLSTSAGLLEGTYLAPVGRRGVILRLEFHTSRKAAVTLAAEFNWAETLHFSHKPRAVHGERIGGLVTDGSGGMYFEFVSGWPRFGLALAAECDAEHSLECGDVVLGPSLPELSGSSSGEPMRGRISRTLDLETAQTMTLTVHFGIGVDIRSALATSQELRTERFAELMAETMQWLSDREIRCSGPAAPVCDIINCNSLYNHFNSSGVTIDSDRLVVTSARSPEYEMNGTYADRDACLYSIPAVLLADPPKARRMLEYVFGVQMKSPGSLSRYMDGVPLQTGFSLDAAVAPLRALWMYVHVTDDPTLLFLQSVQSGLNQTIQMLESRVNPDVALVSTGLTPAGRPAPVPYLTYSNMLVWRALADMSELYNRIRDVERRHETAAWARDLQQAVLENCIVQGPYGPMFCWSLDLAGGYNLGDEPEGSLLLATHLEFCRPSFEPYRNTARWISENTSPEPNGSSSILLANRLLSGDTSVASELAASGLMNDSICSHPAGWSGSSGYLAYALVSAFERQVDAPALRSPSPKRSRITREDVRPGAGWI